MRVDGIEKAPLCLQEKPAYIACVDTAPCHAAAALVYRCPSHRRTAVTCCIVRVLAARNSTVQVNHLLFTFINICTATCTAFAGVVCCRVSQLRRGITATCSINFNFWNCCNTVHLTRWFLMKLAARKCVGYINCLRLKRACELRAACWRYFCTCHQTFLLLLHSVPHDRSLILSTLLITLLWP